MEKYAGSLLVADQVIVTVPPVVASVSGLIVSAKTSGRARRAVLLGWVSTMI